MNKLITNQKHGYNEVLEVLEDGNLKLICSLNLNLHKNEIEKYALLIAAASRNAGCITIFSKRVYSFL